MESRKLGSAQKSVECMTHLMEERHNIVMTHERGLCWCRLCEVGYHCYERVMRRTVGLVVR